MGDFRRDFLCHGQLDVFPVHRADEVRAERTDAGNIFTAGQAGSLHGPGLSKDLFDRAFADDLSIVHEQEVIAELVGFVPVMGHKYG